MDWQTQIHELIEFIQTLDWTAVEAFALQLFGLIFGFFTGLVTD